MEENPDQWECNLIEIYKDNDFKELQTKLDQEKLKIALQITGVKISSSEQLSKDIFNDLIQQQFQNNTNNDNLNNKDKTNIQNNQELHFTKIQQQEFQIPVAINLQKKGFDQQKSQKYYQRILVACQIIDKKFPLIILLGGTSGTGKSTVGSILAARFGISTALSTDTIRQVLRNFMKKEDCPPLFVSTYQAGEALTSENLNSQSQILKENANLLDFENIKEINEMSESEKTIKGYKLQSKVVQQRVEVVIEQYAERKEPIIIEGVHLTPNFMIKIMKKFNNVIPFCICIKDEKKHKERFAVRSKYMTLDKRHNKYIKNFGNIRMIQKWFLEKTDQFLIPKINNVNFDKSLGIIHKTILRYQNKLQQSQNQIIFKDLKNALPLYQEYNKATKNVWSTQSIKDLIHKKANPSENIKRYLNDTINKKENEQNNINQQKQQINDQQQQKQNKSQDQNTQQSPNIQNQRNNIFQEKQGEESLQQSQQKSQYNNKRYQNKDIIQLPKQNLPNPKNIQKTQSSDLMVKKGIQQTLSDVQKSNSNSNIRNNQNKNNNLNKNSPHNTSQNQQKYTYSQNSPPPKKNLMIEPDFKKRVNLTDDEMDDKDQEEDDDTDEENEDEQYTSERELHKNKKYKKLSEGQNKIWNFEDQKQNQKNIQQDLQQKQDTPKKNNGVGEKLFLSESKQNRQQSYKEQNLQQNIKSQQLIENNEKNKEQQKELKTLQKQNSQDSLPQAQLQNQQQKFLNKNLNNQRRDDNNTNTNQRNRRFIKTRSMYKLNNKINQKQDDQNLEVIKPKQALKILQKEGKFKGRIDSKMSLAQLKKQLGLNKIEVNIIQYQDGFIKVETINNKNNQINDENQYTPKNNINNKLKKKKSVDFDKNILYNSQNSNNQDVNDEQQNQNMNTSLQNSQISDYNSSDKNDNSFQGASILNNTNYTLSEKQVSENSSLRIYTEKEEEEEKDDEDFEDGFFQIEEEQQQYDTDSDQEEGLSGNEESDEDIMENGLDEEIYEEDNNHNHNQQAENDSKQIKEMNSNQIQYNQQQNLKNDNHQNNQIKQQDEQNQNIKKQQNQNYEGKQENQYVQNNEIKNNQHQQEKVK